MGYIPQHPAIIIAALIAAVIGYFLWRNRGEPSGWTAGPIIRGKNYSPGTNLAMGQGVWSLVVKPGTQVDGVTKARGPISGGIRLRYRVTGTGLRPYEAPAEQAMLTLYIAREGNNWSARGSDQYNRWYTTEPLPLTEGEHVFDVPFDPANWHCVTGASARDLPNEFAAALADKGRIGLAFGGWGGRMHGVVSDTPVKFELIEWA